MALGFPGLGAVRSLGRAGVPVIGLDPTPGGVGFASRYCVAERCPDPTTEPERLVEYLLDHARRLDEPGVLSPASDAFVLFISRYRDVLGEHFRFNLPSPEVMESAIDKRKLYEMAERVGVAYPTTFYPETLDDVHRIKHEIEYPVYIKPYYSHLWAAAFPKSGKGIKAFTPDQLVAGYERVFSAGVQAMAQSIILGPASNIRTARVYVAQDGRLRALFTTRTVRQWPVEFGVGTMLVSAWDESFAEMGTTFFRDIDYRGVGTIEFKQDDRDGVLKVTDLNPRWWGSIQLAPSSGVDFPLIHYRDLIGQPLPSQTTFREGVRWVDGRGDFGSALAHIREGKLTVGEWTRQWMSARAFSTFAIDDPKPFLEKYQYGKIAIEAPRIYLSRRLKRR
jgi:predicted ATP-grasp superfamily ATP-dependent carboligase